ncbi:MAG TPA: VWA domain-containing protein [Acidobacteriaceae bacterium]|jgi:hypothetical protein
MMLEGKPGDLTASIVAFCRFVRSNGIESDVRQTLSALQVAKAIGTADWQLLAFGLRAVLCSSPQDWDRFQRIFESFWEAADHPERSKSERKEEGRRSQLERQGTHSSFLLGVSSQEGTGKAVSGASAQQQLKKVDFSMVPFQDQNQLEQLADRLLRQLSVKFSRRFVQKEHGDRVDLRRTIRQSIRYGGNPILRAYKGRRRRKTKLVVLLDISGSMNSYSLFLLRFVYALQRAFKRVDSFVFSTSLVEVTDLLRVGQLPDALRRLSQRSAGWSGGTKIGESLEQFNRLFARKLLSQETILIILSDGWDTGEPEILAEEMRFAKNRVQRILWLNPLLGMEDYRPITRGIAAALRYVDVFAPAHNLESLLALEKYL